MSPDVALHALVAQRQENLLERQLELHRLRADVAAFAEEYRWARDAAATSAIERLDGRDAVLTRLDELLQGTSSETAAFVTTRPSAGALDEARAGDLALLQRRVRVRGLYLDSVRNDRPNLDYLIWFHDQGAQIRTLPTLPVRVILHDRETAVVAQDPQDPSAGAVVVRSPGLVAALCALFDRYWDDARDLFDRGDDVVEVLSPPERALLRLLGRGSKDESAARQMGVSVRTVRRMIADLSKRAEAESRFELGLKAVQRGWL